MSCNKPNFNKFPVRLHGEYNTSLAFWKHHVNLLLQSFWSVSSDLCNNKFTWCFHKAKLVSLILTDLLQLDEIDKSCRTLAAVLVESDVFKIQYLFF